MSAYPSLCYAGKQNLAAGVGMWSSAPRLIGSLELVFPALVIPRHSSDWPAHRRIGLREKAQVLRAVDTACQMQPHVAELSDLGGHEPREVQHPADDFVAAQTSSGASDGPRAPASRLTP